MIATAITHQVESTLHQYSVKKTPHIGPTMSASMQVRASGLNAKMEAEASGVLDEIERTLLRKVARESFSCAVKCYDKAGSTGPSEVLEGCARNCQAPYQQSSALVQNVSYQEGPHLSRFIY